MALPDIFHFTHVANVQGIVGKRQLRCYDSSGCIEDLADPAIRSHRQSKRVGTPPGGVVADYVPFYFAPRSPMLYRRCYEGLDPANVVYLVTTTERILATGLAAIVTDGNAAANISRFLPCSEMGTAIDWPLMKARYWNDTDEDPGRKWRRQAEFLVHGQVPTGLITQIAVRSKIARTKVAAALAEASCELPPVSIRPEWYF